GRLRPVRARREGDRARRRGRAVGRPGRVRDHRAGGEHARPQAELLPRGRPELLHRDVGDVPRRDLPAVRPAQHRRPGRSERDGRISAADRGEDRRSRSRPGVPRRHEVLWAEREDRRRAPGLGHDDRRQAGSGVRARRRPRFAVESAARRVRPQHFQRGGEGLMTLTRRSAPRPEAAEHTTRLRPGVLAVSLAVLLAAVVFSLLAGSGELGWQRVLGEIWAQLTGGLYPLAEREAAIVWELRMPRVLLAGLVGAALAGAGAAFQGVFRNPLAEPYLLGAAAGAGMAATMVVVFAPAVTTWVVGPLPAAAFAGALLGVGLSWVLGRSAGGSGTAGLLLAGVAVTAFLTAVQTFVQQLNTDTIKQVYTWTLGGLNISGWTDVLVALPYIALAAVVLVAAARLLDVLTLGDAEAASLGLRPGRIRLVLLAAASLATAAAVSVSGLIGFV